MADMAKAGMDGETSPKVGHAGEVTKEELRAAVQEILKDGSVNKANILLFLRDKHCKDVFSRFLESIQSMENLNCWLDTREYKTLNHEKKLAEEGKCIFEKYVIQESPHAVSISHQLRTEFEKANQTRQYDQHTFVDLEQAAFLMLAHSNFVTFLNSEQFKDINEYLAKTKKKKRSKKKDTKDAKKEEM